MATQPDSINYIAEVGDFLFATDTVAKIAKGQGTWGDAALVGVTAASFFIAPAKLMQLSNKALNAVIKATTKTLEKDVMSVAARNAASRTLDDALTLKRQGTIPEQPIQRFSGDFDQPVERVGKSVPFEQEGKLVDKYNPEMAGKKYTRPMDEDVDPFDRDKDIFQEADDAIAKRGGDKKLLTKEELNLKDIESSQYYDKRKFTQEEIDERISRLKPQEKKKLEGKSQEEIEDYVRAGEYTPEEIQTIVERLIKSNESIANADAKEVTNVYFSLIRLIESQKIKKTLSPEELKTAQRNLKDIEKEFEDKVVDAVEGEAILKKYESNLPDQKFAQEREVNAKGNLLYEKGDIKPTESLIRYQADISDEAKLGKSEAIVDEALPSDVPSQLKPGTGTDYYKKVPNPEVVAIKVPEKARMDKDLREGLSVPAQKFAELQAEVRKLETFNKANRRKTRNASDETRQELNQQYRDNLDLIEKYQKQILTLKKATPEEEIKKAIEVSEEITKRALERRKYPLGVPTTKEEKIAKAKAEIERLKKEWKTIPAWETETKSKLKKEAKKFADYIERLEGTIKPTVAKSVDTPKPVKPVDSTSAALKPIASFRGENAFLSNMSSSSFKVGQTTYPTVEHFFQAMKTTDPAERAKILAAKTAGEAKKIGRTVTLRKNWNEIREEVMETALRAKFQQNPELKKKLIDTGDVDLIEGNTWGDTFWGQVDGKGQNKLGKLLMKIRDELMKGK